MHLALFDLDNTLLPLDSDHAWGEFAVSIGWHDAAEFRAANDRFYDQYKMGTLNLAEYIAFTTAGIRERGPEVAQQAYAQFMRDWIRPAIQPQALALLEQHRAAGDTLVLITATNEFVTGPIAQALGFEHLLAVELEKDSSGWYNGKIAGTPSFREGKITRLESWLQARGSSLAQAQSSIFYSDSINDLPLLEAVQTPVATNPDAQLRSIATERGWRILDLFAPESTPTHP